MANWHIRIKGTPWCCCCGDIEPEIVRGGAYCLARCLLRPGVQGRRPEHQDRTCGDGRRRLGRDRNRRQQVRTQGNARGTARARGATSGLAVNYRRLGRCGLQLSELSFGSWVTYANQVDTRVAHELMAAAFAAGINFFDNAEVYANGRSEEIMGTVLKTLRWPRMKYVVSTKFYWGLGDGPEREEHAQPQVSAARHRRLARASAARLRRHRLLSPRRSRTRPSTRPSGRCTTSSPAAGALLGHQRMAGRSDPQPPGEIAERHHLHKPVTEQAQYNLLHRHARGVGVRTALRGHRSRPHDLEPARVRSTHRQVPARHPCRLARNAVELRLPP